MGQFFTEAEARELNAIRLSGGVFVEVYDNPNKKIIVYKSNNDGGFKPLTTLDGTLAKKFYDLRGGNDPNGVHMLSLSYVINKFIRHKYF